LIGKALRLAPRDRARAVRALLWLVSADAAVRILPYSKLARAAARIPASRSPRAAMTPAECSEAVRRAARLWPSARCLPQALAAYVLLRRAGLTPTLTLGAGFDPGHRFEAHAWLDCQGVTVTGGDADGHYSPLIPAGRDR
jgi:hypothetical protein